MAKKIPISEELRKAALKLWFMLMRESGRMVPLTDDEGEPFIEDKYEPLTESELDAALSHLNHIASEPVSNRPTENRWRDSAIASEVDDRRNGGMSKQEAYEDVAYYMEQFGYSFDASYIGTIYRNWKKSPNARRGKIELIDKNTQDHS